MEMSFREMASCYVNDTIVKMKNKIIISAVMFLATLVVFVLWFLLVKDGANADLAKKFYYVFLGAFAVSMYYTWMNRANLKSVGEGFFGYENMSLFNSLFVAFVFLLCFAIAEVSNRSFVRGALGLLMLIGLFLLLVNITELAAEEIEEAKELYMNIKRKVKEERMRKEKAERKVAVKIAEMEDEIDVLKGGISIPTFIRLKNMKNKKSVV